MPSGSTPIDFAYLIHTDVGHRCVGAKANKKIVPLDFKLKSGDIVEILTSKSSRGPSRDWLKIAKTSGAKNRIRIWFKKEMREENIQKGKEYFEKEMEKYKIESSLELTKKLKEVSIELGFAEPESMFENIGYGKLTAYQVLSKIIPQERIFPIIPLVKPKKRIDQGIRVQGINDMMIRFSRCCNPVPGDKIIGYITRGRGVSIHKVNCSNVDFISAEKDRLVKVEWIKTEELFYPLKVKIVADDRPNLVSDILLIFSSLKITVSAINAITDKNNIAYIDVTLSINNIDQLQEIIRKIKKIKSVLTVKRVITF
ncbi:GTP pyrophosphokinase [subsurface metagenome]